MRLSHDDKGLCEYRASVGLVEFPKRFQLALDRSVFLVNLEDLQMTRSNELLDVFILVNELYFALFVRWQDEFIVLHG